mmetsp:Transcript_3239/g.11314  ORF Transcript_3239/g.11314 Transcript_3239/m.11314 type:complete len:238 (+) Transcript_3239:89-802(+)
MLLATGAIPLENRHCWHASQCVIASSLSRVQNLQDHWPRGGSLSGGGASAISSSSSLSIVRSTQHPAGHPSPRFTVPPTSHRFAGAPEPLGPAPPLPLAAQPDPSPTSSLSSSRVKSTSFSSPWSASLVLASPHHRSSFILLSAALAAACWGVRPLANSADPPSLCGPIGSIPRLLALSSAALSILARSCAGFGLCTGTGPLPPSLPLLLPSKPVPLPKLPFAMSSSTSAVISSSSL